MVVIDLCSRRSNKFSIDHKTNSHADNCDDEKNKDSNVSIVHVMGILCIQKYQSANILKLKSFNI